MHYSIPRRTESELVCRLIVVDARPCDKGRALYILSMLLFFIHVVAFSLLLYKITVKGGNHAY